MSFRKVTSLTTLLSFILLIVTSVILYLTPQGKIAFWANWSCWGIGKEEWGALHTNLGLLFLIAGIIHTVLNWKPIVAYTKNKAMKLKVCTVDFNISLAITLVITLMTLFSLPPINAIQTLNESLKAAAAEKYGEPPYGHAEASSLKSFCQHTGLDLTNSVQELEQANLKAISETATLADIAEANGMTPQQVYNVIRPAPSEDGKMALPMQPGMGFGRKSLSGVCTEYSLDVQTIIDGLKGLGIEATKETSMKAIGEKNDMDPHTVFEAIQQLQTK